MDRGIYLGKHHPRYHLPEAFTSLYHDRSNSPSPLLRIFQKFAPDIAAICAPSSTPDAAVSSFISHSPLSHCHEAINKSIAHRLQTDFLPTLDNDSEHNIEEIVDGANSAKASSTFLALMNGTGRAK